MMFPRAFQSYIPRSHCIEQHTYGAIILTADNEVLVVEGAKSGKWSFPKGHGRLNERPLEAAIREVKEETGINLEGIPYTSQRRLRSSGSRKGGTYFVFHVDTAMPIIPEDTEEIGTGFWCPLSRLPSLTKNMDLTTFCSLNLHLYPEKL
jgi:8-oxo-dGTP pyrophosphatase MutT (NUDIX family)